SSPTTVVARSRIVLAASAVPALVNGVRQASTTAILIGGSLSARAGSSERAGQAGHLGDRVLGHLVGQRADPPQARVAPVALHLRLHRVAHAAEDLDAAVGSGDGR